MSDFSLKGMIKLVVYGVPGLLILLGAFLYVSGVTLELATGNAEMKVTGLWLIAIGIILYVIEFIIAVYDYFS